VTAFTHGWARDLGLHGITVNCMQPGPIDTDMNPAEVQSAPSRKAMTALDRYGQPDEIAALVAFLASPEAGDISGACINADDGTNA
jgi:3-oxoacyl-[acyl-carrier protein] reductase